MTKKAAQGSKRGEEEKDLGPQSPREMQRANFFFSTAKIKD
jgi:hypothetical protein